MMNPRDLSPYKPGEEQLVFQKGIREELRVTMEWNHLSFAVQRQDTGEMRQILNDCSGIVLPGQCVAVLGPSGCGKSTLLNLLAGRKNLLLLTSPDVGVGGFLNKSTQEGTVLANGVQFSGHQFNEFGGFVQQDDVLLGSMTPRELFTFACRMRTQLDEGQIRMRVASLVSALRLGSCQDTCIGNTVIRGVSGGERKRASIGYELITNPSMLMLDEPTSGLDSNTALQVVKLLKRETARGMSIITTIHQPSSEIFHLFDKIIVLSEGHVIYQDSPTKVERYFK